MPVPASESATSYSISLAGGFDGGPIVPGVGRGGGTIGAMVAVVYCWEPGGVGAAAGPGGAGDVGYEGRVSGSDRTGVCMGVCAALPFAYGALYC
jgi:hypothetical protein